MSELVEKNTEFKPIDNEIAYWKSRAISLQYENQMLYKHIEKLYVDVINVKSLKIKDSKPILEHNYNKNFNYYESNDCFDSYQVESKHFTEDSRITKEFRLEFSRSRSKTNNSCQECDCEMVTDVDKKRSAVNGFEEITPSVHTFRQMEEEMMILYGIVWKKIIGLEAVVKINYEMVLSSENVNYWPILPIKM